MISNYYMRIFYDSISVNKTCGRDVQFFSDELVDPKLSVINKGSPFSNPVPKERKTYENAARETCFLNGKDHPLCKVSYLETARNRILSHSSFANFAFLNLSPGNLWIMRSEKTGFLGLASICFTCTCQSKHSVEHKQHSSEPYTNIIAQYA